MTNFMLGFQAPVRGAKASSPGIRGVSIPREGGLSLHFTLEDMALPLGKGIGLLTRHNLNMSLAYTRIR